MVLPPPCCAPVFQVGKGRGGGGAGACWEIADSKIYLIGLFCPRVWEGHRPPRLATTFFPLGSSTCRWVNLNKCEQY